MISLLGYMKTGLLLCVVILFSWRLGCPWYEESPRSKGYSCFISYILLQLIEMVFTLFCFFLSLTGSVCLPLPIKFCCVLV